MPNNNTYKTTNKDFKLFVNECRKWIDRYGLKDWSFDFHHEDYLDEIGCLAISVWGEIKHRSCRIFLQETTWEDKPTIEGVETVARHEVRHILLAKLQALAERRFVRSGEIEGEIHAIIQRLEVV